MYIIWLVLAHILNLISTLSHDLPSTFTSLYSFLGKICAKVHYLETCRGLTLGYSEVKSWADWIGLRGWLFWRRLDWSGRLGQGGAWCTCLSSLSFLRSYSTNNNFVGDVNRGYGRNLEDLVCVCDRSKYQPLCAHFWSRTQLPLASPLWGLEIFKHLMVKWSQIIFPSYSRTQYFSLSLGRQYMTTCNQFRAQWMIWPKVQSKDVQEYSSLKEYLRGGKDTQSLTQ